MINAFPSVVVSLEVTSVANMGGRGNRSDFANMQLVTQDAEGESMYSGSCLTLISLDVLGRGDLDLCTIQNNLLCGGLDLRATEQQIHTFNCTDLYIKLQQYYN